MGDFYQNGVVTTLHNLSHSSVEDLEEKLLGFQKSRPMSLVLPSLYSELETDALATIVDELTRVPYLNQIVVGLDRASQSEYEHALQYFSKLPQDHRVLWNEGPRLQAIDKLLEKNGLAPAELGKGRNVWYCLGYVLASGKSEAVALHDCDIKTYTRELLARLIYPVANPNFNYEFCKGYYPRVADGKKCVATANTWNFSTASATHLQGSFHSVLMSSVTSAFLATGAWKSVFYPR